MALYLTLFLAGLVTILLPCILPLIPIVLGVSITGRNKWRPLLTIAGMLISFVGFTFLLQLVLAQFVELADIIRIATFYVLLLFGVGFLTHERVVQFAGAALGSLFFLSKGPAAVAIAFIVGILAMECGSRIATRIQQFGADIQTSARQGLGEGSPWTAFVIGLTLGLVWVPCAGPALGFAFALVREQPGAMALFALLAYGLGTAVPLLLVGYGGQAAVHSVRSISRFSGVIKQVAGVFLILTAVALHFRFFETVQIFLLDHTNFGDIGTRLEERFFSDPREASDPKPNPNPNPASMNLPKLPTLIRAPELTGLGPWHNSEPLTMAGLRGKVVLVDFWTYSCINCIRTLPHIRGYWDTFSSAKLPSGENAFVLLGVHTPEFVFEKSEANVADAIKRHELTYPIAQDNDFGTWNAFANRYWPAKYLIDKDGYIRYTHFGEGAYEETDAAIQSLLAEAGVTVESGQRVAGSGEQTDQGRDRSRETYLGERSWPAFGNGVDEPDEEVHTYTAPDSMKLHFYYLIGDWQLADGERQVLRSPQGEIRMQFLGDEINLVLGPEEGVERATGDVFIDGKKVKTITIDTDDLYNLYTGDYGEHELVLKLNGAGVAGYAFTFGG